MQSGFQSLFAVSEVELVYRSKVKPADRPHVSSTQSAYDILIAAWDANKIEMVEQCYVLLLNRSNYCIGISNIGTGGITGCVVDPKIVFATALKANATGIILAHNHPSGNLKPSNADIHLTQKIREAGKFLDLSLMDHMIVTPQGYYSFAEEGML
jgi:DNA repair protein RadC